MADSSATALRLTSCGCYDVQAKDVATLELFRTLRRLVVDGGRLSVADNVALTQVRFRGVLMIIGARTAARVRPFSTQGAESNWPTNSTL